MNKKKLDDLIHYSILLAIFTISTIQAQVCRVSTNGSSGASGASWSQSKSLTAALADSVNCPEIWVKSGVYYPTTSTNRAISFSVKPGVKLYGGFYGTEIALQQRDYLYNKATLSGNIGDLNTATDNSFNLVYLNGNTGTGIFQSTIIDGFIIRDGYAGNFDGAGLLCDANGVNSSCSPWLRNLEFRDNIASNGGAMYNAAFNGGDVRPIIENTLFINNKTLTGSGGAIYNRASDGGISSPSLGNVEFINNSAENLGGAMANSASDNAARSNPLIDLVTFTGNSAQKGGAMSSQSFTTAQSLPVVINSTFNNNSSTNQGGAIYNFHASITLNNVTIAGNTASTSGGGVYNEFSTVDMDNSILWSNQAPSGAQAFLHSTHIAADYNVIQNNCAGFGTSGSSTQNCSNIITSSPLLGSLQNNRGFTRTMLPSAGSSAIDSGDNSTCLPTDQRGIARPQNSQCDIGSVEVLNTCRVTTAGSTIGNGSNWDGQAMALVTALSTPNCLQVWIKTGTYTPTTGSDRTQSFNIQPGATVMGGFGGTESNPNDRNIASNPVILSGNIGSVNDDTDNSYHVISLDGTQGTKILATTVIADLIVQEGYASANFFDFPNNSGAGIYCNGSGANSACSPTLDNLTFYLNQATGGAGGAIYNDADNNGTSNPQLFNVKFQENTAINGGAIYNAGNNGGISSPVIITGNFLNNTASGSGGAVYNNAINGGASRSQFLFTQFSNNGADYGGAIYNAAQTSGINTASLNQVTLTGNHATVNGGAFYSAGWNNGMSKPTIQDVTFNSNSATRGGAMFLNDLAGNGTAELNRVTFSGNLATDGGALYNDGENGFSHPNLTNVTFANNFAINNGGGIFNNGDNGASSPTILNATFKGNSADRGGAMYNSADPTGVSSPIVDHVIMWGNNASTEGETIYHNLAESNVFDSVLEFGCPTFGVGNANCQNIISTNPLLASLADNGGFTQTMLPATGSSAIDAGNNIFCAGEDQRGESRPKGPHCDIGAVEVDSQAASDIIFKNGFN